MKPSIVAKLEALHERHEEVQALLGDAQTIADQERFRALSREYAQLSDVSRCFTDWQQVQEDIETAQMMLDDPEMREMAQDELREAKEKSEQLEQQLQVLLLPKDPDDERNAFLEVRAGTGGDEAALFAGDLFRMYSRYAEARRWRVEIMSASEGEHGGYKEIIAKISGDGVYGRLKFESGGHRVQRVPATESQGRIHTSACTVAVMPGMGVTTPISYTKTTTQSSSRMDIYQVSTVNEWWGLTTMYNGSTEVDPFSSNWAWGKIQLDADFSDLSENKRLAVIAHEMGHVMGLAHSDFSNVLMRADIAYNSSSTSRAQTNDLGGINYLYK